MIDTVGESVIEIRLESGGAGAHMPRAVFQLRAEQIADTALVSQRLVRAATADIRNMSPPGGPQRFVEYTAGKQGVDRLG